MAGITPISDVLTRSQPEPRPEPIVTPNPAESDPWIFRDGKRNLRGQELVADLRRRVTGAVDSNTALDALIEAGEVEAALADSQSADATLAACVTDCLASAVVSGECSGIARAAQYADAITAPGQLSIAPPEGFTYYALHPSDFARLASTISSEAQRYAVIGIRSIGTTLSAVVLTALAAQGKIASRITVRPTGHPYSRRTDFTADQFRWIEENRAAQFLVVDEGPGRSGSTFLSVAEALVRAGVPRQDITILGSRQPDLSSLCADDAINRWREFRFLATTPSVNQRFAECTYAGGGEWRGFLLPAEEPWPASWTQMERLKFISPDRRTIYKFEGMGPLGAEARDRAYRLAAAGFGPQVRDADGGFLAYELVSGKHPGVERVGTALLDRMAEYCAFRYAEFRAGAEAQVCQLREMLEFNVAQEFGVELTLPVHAFCTERPVITDGRMDAYEWILNDSGQLIKTDGVDHGDNHFFPGPCDITWDLAGIAIERQLAQDGTNYLLEEFRRRTGVEVSRALPLYKLAYSVFRLGFCKMAISTVQGSPEEHRLRGAYKNYRAIAQELLQAWPASSTAR